MTKQPMTKQPIFILGAPRSGTTFLASLLGKTEYGHPFETHFITKYYKLLANYGDLSNFENFSKLLKDILEERPVQQWNLNLDIKGFFDTLNQPIQYATIVDKLCLMASQKRGFQAWGDKTPNYLGDLNIIYELFPNSKYIYIVRDGRDVALSLHKKIWGPNNIYYSALYWNFLNSHNITMDALSSSENILILKYEDLLDDVESNIKRIYSFIGISYQKNEVSDLVATVKKGNYNKWKTTMSPRQIKTFDSIAANTLQKFGYDTSVSKRNVPAFWKTLYAIHHYYFRARHLFIINVIDGIKIRFFGKAPFGE